MWLGQSTSHRVQEKCTSGQQGLPLSCIWVASENYLEIILKQKPWRGVFGLVCCKAGQIQHHKMCSQASMYLTLAQWKECCECLRQELRKGQKSEKYSSLLLQGRTLLDFVILTLEFIYREVGDDHTIILSLLQLFSMVLEEGFVIRESISCTSR